MQKMRKQGDASDVQKTEKTPILQKEKKASEGEKVPEDDAVSDKDQSSKMLAFEEGSNSYRKSKKKDAYCSRAGKGDDPDDDAETNCDRINKTLLINISFLALVR